MKISLIAAVAKNRVIGRDGKIPWDLPEDRAYFREKTLGRPLVMGRRTLESIGKPLPGRRCIVLSRNRGLEVPGCLVLHEIGGVFALLGGGEEEVFIAGGAGVYNLFLPFAETLYITEVDAAPDGDAFFPDYDADRWTEISAWASADPESKIGYVFRTLIRRRERSRRF